MSNPVVLIATHCRKNITSRTIEQLQRQSVVPKIILVASIFEEIEYFDNKYDDVTVIPHRNHPLGAKWQYGAYYAANHFKADPLIILGSDDLLGAGYIERICHLMQERKKDFIGIHQWWILNEETGIMHQMEYTRKDFPLGGGKAISHRMLQKMKFQVFDTHLDRRLDDYSWNQAKKSGYPHEVLLNAHELGLNIISIKGNWETMNSATAILKAPSCKEIGRFNNGKQKLEELL